jgi:hypothetical protein
MTDDFKCVRFINGMANFMSILKRSPIVLSKRSIPCLSLKYSLNDLVTDSPRLGHARSAPIPHDNP